MSGQTGKRKEARRKLRLRCELEIAGERREGTLVDVSEGGLAVMTDVFPERGTEARVSIRVSPRQMVDVVAVAWNKRRTAPGSDGESRCRLGMVVVQASDEYLKLVTEPERAAGRRPPTPPRPWSHAPPPKPEPREESVPAVEEGEASFRVRLGHKGGPRSRIVVLAASSVEDAGSRALADLGADWRVLEVESA